MAIIKIILSLGIIALLSDCSSSQEFSVQKARSDFDFLRNQILIIHPDPFIFTTEEEEERLYFSLMERISLIEHSIEFYDIVSSYVTSFRDGHTFASMSFLSDAYQKSLSKDNSIIPFTFDFKESDLYISSSTHPEFEEIIGAKLTSLNGYSSKAIVNKFQNYYSKKASYLDNAHVRMFNEYYWRCFGSFKKWKLQYMDRKGIDHTIEVSGLSELEMMKYMTNSVKEEMENSAAYEFEYLDDKRAGILTVNFMTDPKSFNELLEEYVTAMIYEGIPYFIIDMRNNGGGNSRLGEILYSYLSQDSYEDGKMYVKMSEPIQQWYRSERTDHPLYTFVDTSQTGSLMLYPDTSRVRPIERNATYTGNTFLLTSRKTYSSGHMFAGLFKCNNLGIVIGQETGQTTKTVGDAFQFELPYSKIGISVSYKIFESSCEQSYDHGYKPDIAVSYSKKELQQGLDKELSVVDSLITIDLLR